MNNEMAVKTALVKSDEKTVEYVPYGAVDKIKLSIGIVKSLCATPTKSGRTCDDRQAMKFIMLCQAQHLNPFAGDAYLLGYDGKDGPQFSLITAHQAFLKRAEVSPDYDGMESGVIVRRKDGDETMDIEGDFYDTGRYILVGGWATVHHKKRKVPTKRRVRLERFQKGYGVWQDDPGGMICKCAEADALRSTFPTMLGGLYTPGEAIEVAAEPASERMGRLVAIAEEPSSQPAQAEPTKVAEPQAETDPRSILELAVTDAGFTFSHLIKWGLDSGNIKDADSLPDFPSIPKATAERLLRSKKGLLDSLATIKKEEA